MWDTMTILWAVANISKKVFNISLCVDCKLFEKTEKE